MVDEVATAPACDADSNCIVGENTRTSAKSRHPHAPPPAAGPPFDATTTLTGSSESTDGDTERDGVAAAVPEGVFDGVTEAEGVVEGLPPMERVADGDGVDVGVLGGVTDDEAVVDGESVFDGDGVMDGVGGVRTTLTVWTAPPLSTVEPTWLPKPLRNVTCAPAAYAPYC